jgi:CRISPR/Cas system CMR-associated protein Cmr3 (group 5 of RAMP superfamily)
LVYHIVLLKETKFYFKITQGASFFSEALYIKRKLIINYFESNQNSIDKKIITKLYNLMKKIIFILTLAIIFTTTSFAQKGNTWVKKHYTVSGNWSVETEGSKTYLVLHSDFKTSKGPDLKLFLMKKNVSSIGKSEAVEKQAILIGKLKSIKGEQRYLIPKNITVSEFKSLVIHCQKYTKVWGATAI